MKQLLMIINEDRFFLSHRKDIALAARKEGWDVKIICKDTGQRKDVEALGLEMIELPINPTGVNLREEFRTWRFLYTLYKKNRDAVVHHVGLKNILWGGLAARLTGVRGVVNAVSGLGVTFSGEKMGWRAKGILSIMRYSHHRKGLKVIFQNQEDIDLFRQHGIVEENQCEFIKGSGVDLNEFRYVPEQDSDKLRVVFSARMVKEKGIMELKAFRPSVLKDILHTYAPSYTHEDLLALYLYTGGVAKYVEQLIDNGHLTSEAMLSAIVSQNSIFIDEGKAMLIEGFGRDYGIYFTILSLIAQGHNTRSDIEGILKQEIGGYLTKLLDDYELITKQQPLFEKSANKNVRYTIEDNFLCFWFRFIYKYNYMIEVDAFQKLRDIVHRDYETYSGKILEKFFREKMIESVQFTRIGSWHDRKGENEIDIIAADDLAENVAFYEVKRNASNADLAILRAKAEAFFKATGQYHNYAVSYHGLSLDDM